MLLSVIIPYYNADAWIGKMLDSLLDQDLDPNEYEILVVDDASEREMVVLKDYVNRFPHIHYHRIAHGGMALARNYGISVAKGKWLYFCDADDYVQPQIFGGMLRAAEERDLEMIAAHTLKINENDPIPTPRRNFADVSETMTGLEYVTTPNAFFTWGVWAYLCKRSLLEENGLKYEDIYFVEDRLFTFEVLKKAARCATIDVDLYYYVQHDTSFFHEKRKLRNPECIDAFFVYMERVVEVIDHPDTPPQIAESLKKRLHSLTSFYILSNAFLYSPLEVNASSIDRLSAMGFYPVAIRAKDTRRNKTIKRLMNRRGLWLLLYRVVHLLPDSYIYQHYDV